MICGSYLYTCKTNLARLLARRADGIHLPPFEQGEIGPDLFRAACDMMREGLVSKRRDRRYRAGASRDWIKVKNPKSPAMNRAKDAFFLAMASCRSKVRVAVRSLVKRRERIRRRIRRVAASIVRA